MKIEKDNIFQKALDILENSDKSLFLTGRAGTGKSTLLTYFLDNTTKKAVVLAPTGVAALNVNGETIHSFFHFKPGVTLEQAKKIAKKSKRKELFSSLDMIIIDEISMVRADLLDCIDMFLKTLFHSSKAFAGIRMVFIGDLYQLPPVVSKEEREYFCQLYDSPYFFSSHVMKEGAFEPLFIELEKIYRQNDEKFIHLLNGIRKKDITEEGLLLLNQRAASSITQDEGYIYLTATNDAASKINEEKLSSLDGKLMEYQAFVEGDFDKKAFPTDERLRLKIGAQVIFLVNDSEGRFVNGTIGKIVDFLGEEILIETEEKKLVKVKEYNWTLYQYDFDSIKKKILQNDIGSFLQFPLKLAWALTIHKSQGKSFDKVIVDLERGSFAHGQTYVALSRCRTFEGLILKKPLKKGHILMDPKVIQFLTKYQYSLAEKECPLDARIEMIQKAILEKKPLNIVYLKNTDEKSSRTILPLVLQEMEYAGKKFLGLEAFCMKRQEKRVFRLDRILEFH